VKRVAAKISTKCAAPAHRDRLDKGDSLISAQFVTMRRRHHDHLKGAIDSFRAKDVREMGRQAGGVRGMKLGGDFIVGTSVVPKAQKMRSFSSFLRPATAKRRLSEYKTQGRGGSGIKTMSITTKTKQLVGAAVITSRRRARRDVEKEPDHSHRSR
jgi:DNA gyrase subunit A